MPPRSDLHAFDCGVSPFELEFTSFILFRFWFQLNIQTLHTKTSLPLKTIVDQKERQLLPLKIVQIREQPDQGIL